MATNGSFNTSDYKSRYLTFAWSVKSQSAQNNSTIIAWTLKGAGDETTSKYYTQNIKATINGQTVYERPMSDGQILVGNGTTVASGTYTLNHDTDGNCSFEVYAEAGIYVWAANCSGSAVFDLPAIGRASTISAAGSVILGNACSVKWAPASAAFRYKLTFAIGDWSQTTGVIHPDRDTQYTYTGFVIPLEAAWQLPDAVTGEMTVTLETYTDPEAKNLAGSDTVAVTVTVPENSSTKPALTMELTPDGGLPEAFAGLYIQGKTRAAARLAAQGQYGASIAGYSLKAEGKITGEDLTTEFLSQYGTVPVHGYATDSRGFNAEVVRTITVLAYSKPKILPASGQSSVTATRCGSDGAPQDTGAYLQIRAKRSYSRVEADGVQKNFCAIAFRYKEEGAEDYGDWQTILEPDSLDSDEVTTEPLLGNLSAEKIYRVQVQAIDNVGETAVTTIGVSTTDVYMHRTKNAMGLGKKVTGENLLDVGWDAHFHGEVMIGDMTLKEYIQAVINEGG